MYIGTVQYLKCFCGDDLNTRALSEDRVVGHRGKGIKDRGSRAVGHRSRGQMGRATSHRAEG